MQRQGCIKTCVLLKARQFECKSVHRACVQYRRVLETITQLEDCHQVVSTTIIGA